MSIRRIIVPLTGAACDGFALAAAFSVARGQSALRRWNLYASGIPPKAVPYVGMRLLPRHRGHFSSGSSGRRYGLRRRRRGLETRRARWEFPWPAPSSGRAAGGRASVTSWARPADGHAPGAARRSRRHRPM